MTIDQTSRMLGLVIAIILLLAPPAFAESDDSNNYLSFSGGIELGEGIDDMDSNPQLKIDGITALGFQHRFNQNWAAELFLADSYTLVKQGETTGQNEYEVTYLRYYGIDTLYYFDTDDDYDVQTYGTLGIGISEPQTHDINSEEQNQIRFGLGLRHLLSDHWAVRGDTRVLFHEDESISNILTIGLSYALDSKRRKIEEYKKIAILDEPGVVGPADEPVGNDSDNDGIPNDRDQCENTDIGANVDAKGCTLDSDNDGVPDHKDLCTDTETGTDVGPKGCMLDSDGDGVGNHRDICLTTPEGRQVDEKGCKFVLAKSRKMILDIHFVKYTRGVAAINDNYAEIEKVATFMKKYSDTTVVIEGHTDNRGGKALNETLSQSRANSVRDLLIRNFGIDGNRITAQGFGETYPIVSNATEEGRLTNRRVVAVMKP